jgi:cytochrome c biogenesis protein CcdA
MVGTVGAARQDGRRAFALTAAAFATGLALGATLVFGALGLLGETAHSRVLVIAAVAVAAAAILSDAAGLRVRPQIRFQVPERWRRTMPLPQALFLYGLLLGAGLTTYLPVTAAWALPALGLGLGSAAGSLAIGLGFALGRALPVLVLATGGEETALAERPQGLRALRALIAASLLLALVAGEVQAAGTVAAPAGDPSVVGADLAWQQPGVGGFLSRNGVKTQLPGNDPAVGGALIAWHAGPAVTVAARDTLAPMVQETIVGAQKLAVSDRWLVWRSGRQIRVQPLSDPSRSALVVEAKRVAELGRPALDGDLVVYHYSTAAGSWLTAVNVANGTRRRVRFARDAQLLNPSLLGPSLLYVRASRCSQELRLGPLRGNKDRVLFELPPLAGQDSGHDRGHTSQGERTPCPHRPRPTTRILWTTALSDTTAYVTVLRPRRGGRTTPTLIAVSRR